MLLGNAFVRSATWCAHFLWRLVGFWAHDLGDLAWLRRILTKTMSFMPFERLLCSISGSSIYLRALFGVCAYDKPCQHFWDQERSFWGHVFATFWQNIFPKKRPRSVWSRCDQILRAGPRNDMHWTANDRSSSMHQKSAPNSFWMRLYGSIFARDILTIFRAQKSA